MPKSNSTPTDIGGDEGTIIRIPGNLGTLTSPLPGWRDIFTDLHLKAPVQMIGGAKFPDSAWDPSVKAQVIATMFVARSGWLDKCDPGAPDDSHDALVRDVTKLLADRTSPVLTSPTLIDEITMQAEDFLPYWATLLSCSGSSRPATWSLVLAALQIGHSLADYFKLKYNRARPAQVFTAIAPIIPTPAYPSYPSGHALQAHLIAECVKWVVPAMASASDALATRIAVNREIAGVHFPSDTKASVRMIPAIFDLLKQLPEFVVIADKARQEWGQTNMISPPRIPAYKQDEGIRPPTS